MRWRAVGIGIGVAALLAIGGYLAAGVILYQQLALAYPHCELRGAEAKNTPDHFIPTEGSLLDTQPYFMPTYEAVHLPSRGDHLNLSAWYVPAAIDDAEGAPTVIVVHGVNDCKQRSTVLLPAGMLHRNGFNVLLIDLRNHGDSQKDNGYFALGMKEYKDVLGAWDWLVTEKNTPPARIGLFGTSLGAATVLIATGQEPRVAAVWADSSFADLDETLRNELIRRGLPAFISTSIEGAAPIISGDQITSLNPLEAMSRLNGRPIFITHGTADQRLSPSYAEELTTAARANSAQVETWIVPGSEHIFAMYDHPDEYERRLAAFFRAALTS